MGCELSSTICSSTTGTRVPCGTDRVGMETVPEKEGRPARDGARGVVVPERLRSVGTWVGRHPQESGASPAPLSLSCNSFWEPAAWCARPVFSLHAQQAAGPKLDCQVRVEAISRVVFDI